MAARSFPSGRTLSSASMAGRPRAPFRSRPDLILPGTIGEEIRMTMPASVTILICVLLTGCSDYLEHKDTVRFNSGDAVATNAAIQIPDPWPPASRNTNLTVQGARGE